MQIKVNEITYKNIKNINFDIEKEKITGIICDNIDDLNDINEIIFKNKKEVSNIKYEPRYSKKKIGLVSIRDVYDIFYGNLYDFFALKAKEYKCKIDNIEEYLKIVGLSESILNKDISILSTSEKIKVLLASVLMYDPDTILLDNIFVELDSKSRDKIFKLLIKLKKFEHKTIIISTLDIDIIYEFIDNIIIINNGKCLACSDKFLAYEKDNILNNDLIEKPLVVDVTKKIYQKNNIKLGKNDSINELIKAIYREVR